MVTDLDGTLLDPVDYSHYAARPALDALARRRIPVVLCSSKTRAEMEPIRAELDNGCPFVVENGGALYVPIGYFPNALPGAVRKDRYDAVEFGTSYAVLVGALRSAAAESGCAIRSFADWTAEEVASACGLPLDRAELARQREYDEPFQTADEAKAAALRDAIERRGFRVVPGGRFLHITGDNDKAGAVRMVVDAYRRWFAVDRVIGLGDALNDAGLLQLVDVPVIVNSTSACRLLERVPHARITRSRGPAGWNEAILELLDSGGLRHR